MLVFGPTLMLDVPGLPNVSLRVLKESNAPYNTLSKISKISTPRYDYKTHAMLTAAWGIALGDTAAETNIDAQIMYDVGALAGAKGPAGNGAFAKTTMLRAEYHF